MGTKKKRQPKAKVISIFEMIGHFPDEQAAIDYLTLILWPDGPVCPYCNGHRISERAQKNYYRCKDCLKIFTIRVGTIFHRSHVPLHKWLYAMYLMVTSRKGISSLQLSKEIGVTQKTAWFLLHRIRTACEDDNGGSLYGIVEADEAYFGGKESNKHESKKLHAGRGAVGKSIVIGIRERGGKVITKLISSTGAKEIQDILAEAVCIYSVVCTDELSSYVGMPERIHKTVNHSAKVFVDGMAHTNGIESVWAVLKRGFYGIYHSFNVKHLQRNLNEFMFRFNSGNVKINTLDRIGAMIGMCAGKRLTFEKLVA